MKFEVIYRDILKKKLSEQKSKELGEQFSKLALEGVIQSEFVKGAYEFLDQYYKKIFFYIISGTPEEEMVYIAQARGLKKFFRGIYGSPRTKGEIMKMIMRQDNLHSGEIIFVGDSINDYAGAREAGIQFIGRTGEEAGNPFAGVRPDLLVKDIAELKNKLMERSLLPVPD